MRLKTERQPVYSSPERSQTNDIEKKFYIHCVSKHVPSLAGYNFNTRHQFFYNFWHVSTEDIQTSATCITFSITSYLLNLCCSEAAVTEMTRILTIF